MRPSQRSILRRAARALPMLATRLARFFFFLLLFTHGCSLINVVRHACIEVFFYWSASDADSLTPRPALETARLSQSSGDSLVVLTPGSRIPRRPSYRPPCAKFPALESPPPPQITMPQSPLLASPRPRYMHIYKYVNKCSNRERCRLSRPRDPTRHAASVRKPPHLYGTQKIKLQKPEPFSSSF
jgi:hypothetical protein